MLTRCPDCDTTFRVTPDQLKVRSGRVRCGECNHVFSALDTLIEEPPVMLSAPTPDAPSASTVPELPSPTPIPIPIPIPTEATVSADATSPPALPSSETGVEVLSLDLLTETPPPAAAVMAEDPGDPVAAWVAQDAAASSIPVDAAPSPASVALLEDEPTPHAQHPIVETAHWGDDFPPPAAPPRRWPWIVGGIMALLLLAVQAAIALRVELSVMQPEARPALAALCSVVGCKLGLPQKAELLSIESSNLQPAGPATKQLVLTATLKNRAPFAQQYPHLELTLTDSADKAIARKVLAPPHYLSAGDSLNAGIDANGDLSISINIEHGDLAASGYRLYLFYP